MPEPSQHNSISNVKQNISLKRLKTLQAIEKRGMTKAFIFDFDGTLVDFVESDISSLKYKEALDFIRANGYEEFVKIVDRWSMQYGKYE